MNVYGDLLRVHPLRLREKEVSGHLAFSRSSKSKVKGDLSKFSAAPCIYCGEQVGDKLTHYITACSKYDGTREYFWTVIKRSSVSTAHAYTTCLTKF